MTADDMNVALENLPKKNQPPPTPADDMNVALASHTTANIWHSSLLYTTSEADAATLRLCVTATSEAGGRVSAMKSKIMGRWQVTSTWCPWVLDRKVIPQWSLQGSNLPCNHDDQ